MSFRWFSPQPCHQQQLMQLLMLHESGKALAPKYFLSYTNNKHDFCYRRSAHAVPASPAASPTVSPPKLVQQTNHQQQPLVFENHQLAYGHRSLPYLVRAYFVLQLCRMQRLTRNASKWAQFGARVLGERLFGVVMKASFFGHFTGAEDTQRVRQCVKTLYAVHNIRPILHYHAERELGECKNARQRAEAVKSNVELTMESMKIVSEVAPDAFAAIKITAFFDPQVLAKLTSTIMTTRLLSNLAESCAKGKDFGLTSKEAKQLLNEFTSSTYEPAPVAVFKMLHNLVEKQHSLADWSVMNLSTNFLPGQSPLFFQHTRPGIFTSGEHVEMLASWQQIEHILDTARQLKVKLFIDAEQTWLQPAIGQLALLAMQRCNRKTTVTGEVVAPRVWSTLQCYLRDAGQTYREYTDIADRENFVFATKFVRGAYIWSECDRAKAMQYDCAIWPTYEATNDNYDRLADVALLRLKGDDNRAGLQVAFATHNEKSIGKITEKMRQMNIDTNRVAFGQLYGMCDRITYDLARTDFTVLKVVPYGPIPLLTPYFVRRAEENSLMLGRCEKDLSMLKMELAQRLRPTLARAKVVQ